MNKFLLLLMLIPAAALAEIIYGDTALVDDITDGSYSIANRDGSGSDGDAYDSLGDCIAAATVGDTIELRGGTFRCVHTGIPTSLNGTAWTTGNFTLIRSRAGEWAILDGMNNLPVNGELATENTCVLGLVSSENDGTDDIKYWKFERIEIRNGSSADGNYAIGFRGNGGPLHFKQCAFRDNYATTSVNNPCGLGGIVWSDCIVEYCYFVNNGGPSGPSENNSVHLDMYSDYNTNAIAENGFTYTGHHRMRNIVRYNYFDGGTRPSIAIKHKASQYFTGRNPAGGHDYDDTYKAYGDDIHHNLFRKSLFYAVEIHGDFNQVHHNLFDSCYGAILLAEADVPPSYKAVVFNNTIRGYGMAGIVANMYSYYAFNNVNLLHYIYNNILDSCGDAYNRSDIGLWRNTNYSTAVLTGTKISRNLITHPLKNETDPTGDSVIFIGNTLNGDPPRYTIAEYTSVVDGTALNWLNSTSGLFTTKFKTDGAFAVDGSYTIADGGIGGAHPLVAGNLPSDVGAGSGAWIDTLLMIPDSVRSPTWTWGSGTGGASPYDTIPGFGLVDTGWVQRVGSLCEKGITWISNLAGGRFFWKHSNAYVDSTRYLTFGEKDTLSNNTTGTSVAGDSIKFETRPAP